MCSSSGSRPGLVWSSWCARRPPSRGPRRTPHTDTVGVGTCVVSCVVCVVCPAPGAWTLCCQGAPSHRGAAGNRTPDLRRAKAALSRLSYGPGRAGVLAHVVGAPGLEPGTSALSGPRSNHLSYAPGWVCGRCPRALCRRRSRPGPMPHPAPAGSPSPVPTPRPVSPPPRRPRRAVGAHGAPRPGPGAQVRRFPNRSLDRRVRRKRRGRPVAGPPLPRCP